jgi:sugar diacid utilization regulator
MADNVTSLPGTLDRAREEATHALAARLAGQKEELARRVAKCWREEIVDYHAASDEHLLQDQLASAAANLDALVASLETGQPPPEAYFERVRKIAARRVNQGIALESFLRAEYMWATVCWETVLSLARTHVPQEREAALEIASRINRLGDRIVTTATSAYLDEVSDRGLLRHDLFDALLIGKGDAKQTVRLARILHLRLAASYVAVVVRGEGVQDPAGRDQPACGRRALDRVVEATRRHVRPSTGSLLASMHNGDLVALFPAAGPADLETVKQDCASLAQALCSEVSIGMSGWHDGRAAIPTAFVEAMDAVKIAEGAGIRGRAVGIDEVLVDAMLDSTVSAQRILTETLRPLVTYDATRHGALVQTLRAYLDARLNVTKSAATLFVHPNTVGYRLRRIKEVCGRDPDDPDDLLVLALALKEADLESAATARVAANGDDGDDEGAAVVSGADVKAPPP